MSISHADKNAILADAAYELGDKQQTFLIGATGNVLAVYLTVGVNIASQAKGGGDFQSFVALETLSPSLLVPVGVEGRAAMEGVSHSAPWADMYRQSADFIAGSSELKVDDHLYGREGDDTLDGACGNGYLEGGKDTDTYQFTGTFGNDTILDSDGLGVVRVGSDTVTGGKRFADTTWESDDKRFFFTKKGSDLVIAQRDDTGRRNVEQHDHGQGIRQRPSW